MHRVWGLTDGQIMRQALPKVFGMVLNQKTTIAFWSSEEWNLGLRGSFYWTGSRKLSTQNTYIREAIHCKILLPPAKVSSQCTRVLALERNLKNKSFSRAAWFCWVHLKGGFKLCSRLFHVKTTMSSLLIFFDTTDTHWGFFFYSCGRHLTGDLDPVHKCLCGATGTSTILKKTRRQVHC